MTDTGKENQKEELKIEERLEEAIPLLSEFDKGYILGKVENMAAEAKKN